MIIGIILGILAGAFAHRKGYWFFAYFLTGIIGCIVIACLPHTKDPNHPLPDDEVVRLRKKGNYIGLGISGVVFVLGVVLGVLEGLGASH